MDLAPKLVLMLHKTQLLLSIWEQKSSKSYNFYFAGVNAFANSLGNRMLANI